MVSNPSPKKVYIDKIGANNAGIGDFQKSLENII